MAESVSPPNPNLHAQQPITFSDQNPPPSPQPSPPPQSSPSFGIFSFQKRPPIRVTSEFDSESGVFFQKVSSKLFDGFAKLKLSFRNRGKGEISDPHIDIVTKHLGICYDVDENNAVVNGFFDVGPNLKLNAITDLKNNKKNETYRPHVKLSTRNINVLYYLKEKNALVNGSLHLGPTLQFRSAYDVKAQKGELTMIANLSDPGYKFELASAVPSWGLPKATLKFPRGEVSLEEREDEEEKRTLSVSSTMTGSLLNGFCTAVYEDQNLHLRYRFKDEEMAFIPSISLPSNAVSFAFKRKLSQSDKLSYWYNFNTNYWNTVYKRTVGKDYKFKAGYDSEVRHGWASVWVGEESGKAKTAPMKMKVQFMLQVPQDDIKSSVLMFRVKKRWDL